MLKSIKYKFRGLTLTVSPFRPSGLVTIVLSDGPHTVNRLCEYPADLRAIADSEGVTLRSRHGGVELELPRTLVNVAGEEAFETTHVLTALGVKPDDIQAVA